MEVLTPTTYAPQFGTYGMDRVFYPQGSELPESAKGLIIWKGRTVPHMVFLSPTQMCMPPVKRDSLFDAAKPYVEFDAGRFTMSADLLALSEYQVDPGVVLEMAVSYNRGFRYFIPLGNRYEVFRGFDGKLVTE